MNFIEQLKKNSNDKNGFSLLELVLAVAIFSFSSFALATMIIDSNISTRLSADRTDALLYAKEGVEAVRSIRDNNWTAWASTTVGNYGLSINTASGTWQFSSTSDLINNKYTRTVNIATDPVASTSKDVTVNIAWNLTSGRIASTTLVTVFSNWPSVINSSLAVPRGLVSYWSFDDAGASTTTDSVGGNTGTVTGATATTSVKGIANQAYSFNGSSNYINVGTSSTLFPDAFTFSAWINRGTLSGGDGYYQIVGRDSGGSAYAVLLIKSTGKLAPYIYGNASINYDGTGTYTLSTSTWYHVVMTYDSTNGLKAYVNGNLDGSVAANGNPVNVSNATTIGYSILYGRYFNGSIDSVRVYRRALTADEVTTIYNSEKP